MQPGSILDRRYRIVRHLGSGSTGDVYEADNELVGKHVALKVLHAKLSADEAIRARFLAQARVLARLHHPCVAEVFDIGLSEDGRAYFAMELVEGETLEVVLDKEAGLRATLACDMMLQVILALEAAHDQGVTHHDLKPSNIMVSFTSAEQTRVRVLDWGLAAAVFQFRDKPASQSPSHSPPLYMAPELVSGQEADHRADVYSTGAILYRMFADEPPYNADTIQQLLNMFAKGAPRPLTEINRDLPPQLAIAIEKSLARDPAARTPRAEELGSALEECLFRATVANPQSMPADAEAGADALDLAALVSRKPLQSTLTSDNRWKLPLVTPKRDSQVTPSLLLDPRLPRQPGAPQFETYAPQPGIFGQHDSLGNVMPTPDPRPGEKPSPAPNPVRNTAIGIFVGFAVGALLAWVWLAL